MSFFYGKDCGNVTGCKRAGLHGGATRISLLAGNDRCKKSGERPGLRTRFFVRGVYLGRMKLYLAAVAVNERELETYVLQLRAGGFETVSDVKKSEDGTCYQALAKRSRQEAMLSSPSAAAVNEAVQA